MKFQLNEYRRNVTKDELLYEVRLIANDLNGEYLSFKKYKSQSGKYSESTFKRHFGSWLNVLLELGLETQRTESQLKRIGDDMLIDDLRRVSALINSLVVTSLDYKKHGHYSCFTISQRFGSWAKFICCAGLQQTSFISKISDQELYLEIERLWTSLGKQPTTTDMKKGISKYSLDTFTRRFGGWRNALFAFLDYINSEGELAQLTESAISEPLQAKELVDKAMSPKVYLKRSSRNINLKLRFMVLQRDKFTCLACGASPAKNSETELHVDHKLAWSNGGETELDNLQTLCSKCNLGKSNH